MRTERGRDGLDIACCVHDISKPDYNFPFQLLRIGHMALRVLPISDFMVRFQIEKAQHKDTYMELSTAAFHSHLHNDSIGFHLKVESEMVKTAISFTP